ncbi:PREDICTED: uncharacterized protein LOC108610641 [Drosophila arizonae]|uniref:Uncharacterized protein LOC108610641 n=1 Tax=Drosophila arizonae TaxID=7263 RepID=A0ABM1NTQ3_DROAR|nr:PREDICTED: uncharacterized protein LOC108610641 [Drosophila arizonae]
MRFIALSLALLSFVSATFLPGKLKGNIAQAAQNTKKLIQEEKVKFYLSLGQLIVSSDVVNKEELEKWKDFIIEWTPQASTLVEDYAALQQFSAQKEMLLDGKDDDLLNQYTNGEFQRLKNSHMNTCNRLYIAFKFAARSMIRESTDSPGHSNSIVRYFNAFARSKPNVREHHFENLFNLLTLEGVELDEWLAIQNMM